MLVYGLNNRQSLALQVTTLRIGYVQFFVRTDHYALTGHRLVGGAMAPPSVSATGHRVVMQDTEAIDSQAR